MLVLLLLLVWAVLVVLLGAGSIWFQGYIYSEPEANLYWRGAAAGSALALLIAFWTLLHNRNADYDTLFRFSPREEKTFDKFRAIKDEKDDKGTLYKREKNARGLPEYHEAVTPYGRWSRSAAVIVQEDGEDVRFNAERDAKGNYQIEQGKSLRYVDSKNRVMYEESIGQMSTFRWSMFLANILLNAFHFAMWFACLWLILRFQWSHALGLAVVFWIIMTVLMVPMVLDAATRIKEKRAANQPTTQLQDMHDIAVLDDIRLTL